MPHPGSPEKVRNRWTEICANLRRRAGMADRNYLAPRRSDTSRATSRRVRGRRPDAAILSLMARRSRPSFEIGRFLSLVPAPFRERFAILRVYPLWSAEAGFRFSVPKL